MNIPIIGIYNTDHEYTLTLVEKQRILDNLPVEPRCICQCKCTLTESSPNCCRQCFKINDCTFCSASLWGCQPALSNIAYIVREGGINIIDTPLHSICLDIHQRHC